MNLARYSAFFLLIAAFNSNAKFFGELRSGNFLGAINIGVGYQVLERHNLDIGLGYAEEVGPQIFTFTYTYQSPFHFEWFRPLNPAVSVIYSTNDQLFFFSPSQYPESDYYAPTSAKITISNKFEIDLSQQFALYLNTSISNTAIDHYINNTSFFNDNYAFWGLSGIVSIGVGARYMF